MAMNSIRAIRHPAAERCISLLAAGEPAALRGAPTHGAARQVVRQLGERHFVDAALELNDDIKRHPVVVPAPGVKLGVVGGAQQTRGSQQARNPQQVRGRVRVAATALPPDSTLEYTPPDSTLEYPSTKGGKR